MKQDGNKEVAVTEEDGRRVFYIDVGDMSPKEALRVINEIRKKQGMAPVSRSWINWVGIAILITATVYVAIAVMPAILPAILPAVL